MCSCRRSNWRRRLDVSTVITFSGCPGGDPKATQPNWIVSPWPPEFSRCSSGSGRNGSSRTGRTPPAACRAAGVRVAIEMHPNFVAYNPETMLRLREMAPRVIGCNFDPSHMFWQGVDIVTAIRTLGDAIFHVHAKDCRIDRANVMRNGVLDAKSYTRELERSWIFRTVGYGNDALVWKDIVTNLRLVGYDHVLSIEHEDSVMSGAEGLRKAVAFLKDIVIRGAGGGGVLGLVSGCHRSILWQQAAADAVPTLAARGPLPRAGKRPALSQRLWLAGHFAPKHVGPRRLGRTRGKMHLRR